MIPGDEIRQLRDCVCSALAEVGRDMHPQEFKAFLCGGIIANVVGNMSDDYWREFVKVEPCGLPGCDCHLQVGESVTKALCDLREDHLKHSPQSTAE